MTWEITESIEIAATPEAVWSVVADVRRHASLAGSGEIKELRAPEVVSPGATWEADEKIPGAPPFTARSECLVFEPPREFAWRSAPPPIVKGRPDSVPGITWRFRLAGGSTAGTRLDHSVRIVPPQAGAMKLRLFYIVTQRSRRIRAGMRRTVANVKSAVEGSA